MNTQVYLDACILWLLGQAPVTLNSPPTLGGFGSNTFSINTYSTYSATASTTETVGALFSVTRLGMMLLYARSSPVCVLAVLELGLYQRG